MSERSCEHPAPKLDVQKTVYQRMPLEERRNKILTGESAY